MCGIVGVISRRPLDPGDHERMVAALHHRGPDDGGVWLDTEAGLFLGHRRLSIVDLSPTGHQPMVSRSGRLVLTFNGEIYNHAELRKMLEEKGARCWRGTSDSETLLESIATWGLERTLQLSVGMFAFALWDRRDRKLFLVRDRFGEKPLYFGYVDGDFVFGSELKAICAHPRFAGTLDRVALATFAARGYVPEPLSIFRGVSKLEPATVAMIDPGRSGVPTETYWSYRSVIESGLQDPLPNERISIRAVESALVRAVKDQSVADVPVGIFLSGGIDSSLIAALWSKHCSTTPHTYSIGFEEAGFDEAPYARAVAAQLGAKHCELYVTAAEALDVIPRLPTVYDEPFADPAQIPAFLMSRLARQSVKVVLSGDGGDELFGGYTRYQTAARLWRNMQCAPRTLRNRAGAMLGGVPPGLWNFLTRNAQNGGRLARTSHRLRTIDRLDELYGSFRDEWTGEAPPVLARDGGARIRATPLKLDMANGPSLVKLMYCDTISYLPGDILCKVDRAAMANSLEVRAPFLDHRVAQAAARVSLGLKVKGRTGKLILRTILFSHLPARMFARPKAGFRVPLGQWLRGPLKSWADDLLAADRLRHEGHFDADQVARRWRLHLDGRIDATFSLWPLLVFQMWNADRLGR